MAVPVRQMVRDPKMPFDERIPKIPIAGALILIEIDVDG
jgi:hypothetical protein